LTKFGVALANAPIFGRNPAVLAQQARELRAFLAIGGSAIRA